MAVAVAVVGVVGVVEAVADIVAEKEERTILSDSRLPKKTWSL
jgi:hypothetical protein